MLCINRLACAVSELAHEWRRYNDFQERAVSLAREQTDALKTVADGQAAMIATQREANERAAEWRRTELAHMRVCERRYRLALEQVELPDEPLRH